ncbi:hypothetical protein ACB094_07G058000 [Castanea mollissima]
MASSFVKTFIQNASVPLNEVSIFLALTVSFRAFLTVFFFSFTYQIMPFLFIQNAGVSLNEVSLFPALNVSFRAFLTVFFFFFTSGFFNTALFSIIFIPFFLTYTKD